MPLSFQGQSARTLLEGQSARQRPLVILESIHVNYGQKSALKNVGLDIFQGEVIFLTGPSGAGKTTLLNTLAGEVSVSKGRVFRRPELFIAPIFQDLRLLEDFSVYDNLDVSFDPHLFSGKKEFLKELNDLAHILGVKEHLYSLVKNLNGGSKQKVALIRALLSRPDLLLADEPTSSLDLESSKRIVDLLMHYNRKRGLSVVWASHNRDLVKTFTGRIVHIDKGLIVHSGHACFI